MTAMTQTIVTDPVIVYIFYYFPLYITKTRLFKYIEIFASKNLKIFR